MKMPELVPQLIRLRIPIEDGRFYECDALLCVMTPHSDGPLGLYSVDFQFTSSGSVSVVQVPRWRRRVLAVLDRWLWKDRPSVALEHVK